MTKSSCGVWSWYKPQTCASGSGLDRAVEFGVPSPQVDASRKVGISKKEKKIKKKKTFREQELASTQMTTLVLAAEGSL